MELVFCWWYWSQLCTQGVERDDVYVCQFFLYYLADGTAMSNEGIFGNFCISETKRSRWLNNYRRRWCFLFAHGKKLDGWSTDATGGTAGCSRDLQGIWRCTVIGDVEDE